MYATTSSNLDGRPVTSQVASSALSFGRASNGVPAAVASDHDLVRAIARGDRGAMKTLYVRRKISVYRFALRITHNPSIAEDVLSDTFLDVWRCAKAFKANAQVSTWLLAIARNKALSSLRRVCDALDDKWAATIQDPTSEP